MLSNNAAVFAAVRESLYGPSATFGGALGESAHGGKADLIAVGRDVAFDPEQTLARWSVAK
jgi:hypothetical protein